MRLNFYVNLNHLYIKELYFKRTDLIEWIEKHRGKTREDIERKANEYL